MRNRSGLAAGFFKHLHGTATTGVGGGPSVRLSTAVKRILKNTVNAVML